MRCNGIANSVAGCRKHNKEQAAEYPDGHGKRIQNLFGVVFRRRIQTSHHVIVQKSDGSKHQNRQKCVHEVEKSKVVLASIGYDVMIAEIKSPQPFGSCEAIVEFPVRAPKAIGERNEETRKSAEDEKDLCHENVKRIALPAVGENWAQNLKRKDGPRGKEVCQMGRAR